MKQSKTAAQAPARTATGDAAPAIATAPAAAPAQLNVREMMALRDELSTQLNSALSRRNDLNKQLQNPNVANRPGLEARIGELDTRIGQIENQIAVNGRNLAANPAVLVTGTGNPLSQFGVSSGQTTAISIIGIVFVAFPLVVTLCLRFLRRMSQAQVAPPSHETTARLDNIERGVEAIAIEMERVTEGQRFLTKMMSEKPNVRVIGE